MNFRWSLGLLGCLLFWLFLPEVVVGAQIRDASFGDRAMRFWSLRDPVVRTALVGCLLLGITCGVLGSYLVVRRMALFGDALAHAVMPGVALGFLWNMTKDPLAIFLGASVAGLVGALTVHGVRESTHLKEDTSLGLVLSGFYAVGIVLFTMIQNSAVGGQAGLESFLFGQVAALTNRDVVLMAAVAGATVLGAFWLHKELLVTSFDLDFARASGMPVRWLRHGYLLLLTFAVVVSLQAAGVILVSAMLIIPASAAYLLTDRFHRMVWLAIGFGAVAGVAGSFLSFLGRGMPTGPFIVTASAGIFLGALLLSPRHGLLPRWVRQRRREQRVRVENTLKSIHRLGEDHPAAIAEPIALRTLARLRDERVAESERHVEELVRRGFARWEHKTQPLSGDRTFRTTEAGMQRAKEVVRNHRLWELYLAHEAAYAPERVHDDAEEVEHFLPPETVERLRRELLDPVSDPHGKEIPR